MDADACGWRRELCEQWDELPRADPVLHIHRELIHHLSEVSMPREQLLATGTIAGQRA